MRQSTSGAYSLKYVGLTMRVDQHEYERRDSIDQRWIDFLKACDLIPFLIPNNDAYGSFILENIPLAGIIFSGGNTLCSLGGDAPERDKTETTILEIANQKYLPLLGVCRGMQVILHHYDAELEETPNHVAVRHDINWYGKKRNVNSYHKFGSKQLPKDFALLAQASDGVIEAIEHQKFPMRGIMWHPEREEKFDPLDIELFRKHFLHDK